MEKYTPEEDSGLAPLEINLAQKYMTSSAGLYEKNQYWARFTGRIFSRITQ